ncbi:hypothetical protein M9H77_32124 [Catharanthus roseus]|uniref:Uncharacterized protein n=1 Tax=Catharanthus roseus TaxID=4058 RepID=A0ACC0A3A8_CATRO|nr:hypothetical protein M9H77_32124 [Catharanthus roseus]
MDSKFLGLRSMSILSDVIKPKTTSRRLADRKIEKFEKNITKQGSIPETTAKKAINYPVGPILLGFFLFFSLDPVTLFEIIRTTTSGGMT